MYFLKRFSRGIFNRYRKGMPVPEMLAKDLSFLALWIGHWFRNRGKPRYLLVYPHYPSRKSTIYRIGNLLGYNVTNNPDVPYDIAVYWEYLTFRKEFGFLEEVSRNKTVVNLHSRDISKVFIDEAFMKVFGYSAMVDPLTFRGRIVKKSDINARHDGMILEAPVEKPDKECVYQLLIDNSDTEDRVMDIRVPVVGTVLPFVYLKYRPVTERFRNITLQTEIRPAGEVLTAGEIALLNAYCRELKLDYGELDVLRHRADGRIYVVDVNNTPQGPPAHTSRKDSAFALHVIAKAFRDAFTV